MYEVPTMKYSFEFYFTTDELDRAYASVKASIKIEVDERLGLKNTNLSEQYYIDYWKKKCNIKWLKDGAWDFLWRRSGREKISKPIDFKTFIKCCVAHLQGCMIYSYDNCDFQEKWYGLNPDIHSMAIKGGYCSRCIYRKTEGSSSDKYCARCYRAVLNDWRP